MIIKSLGNPYSIFRNLDKEKLASTNQIIDRQLDIQLSATAEPRQEDQLMYASSLKRLLEIKQNTTNLIICMEAYIKRN